MNYLSIARMPSSITLEQVKEDISLSSPSGWHESLLRSYHIVQKVKWLLEMKTSPEVISELIDVMEGRIGEV